MDCPLCQEKVSLKRIQLIVGDITKKDVQPPVEDDVRKAIVSALVNDMSREDRLSLRGTINASLRLTHSGGSEGRPRLKRRKRCPCQKNTYTRAKARGFACCREAGVPV